MYKHSKEFKVTSQLQRALVVLSLTTMALFGEAPANEQTDNGNRVTESGLKLSQAELMRQFQASSEGEYTLGPGDEIELQVPTHTELQGHHILGPDGKISLPIVGAIALGGQTREHAAETITTAFAQYYKDVPVAIQVTKYGSNRIIVVGRVASPGPIFFETAPTLLEALAKSGAYNSRTPGVATPGAIPTLSRCAVYRGSDEVLWVDLKKLFSSGTSAVDLTLRRGDIVYVPDDQEEQVSVLGQVRRPGAVALSADMRLVDVITLAGGLSDDAAGNKIRVLRPSTGLTREVAFQDMITAHGSKDTADLSLQNGDVIYVPQNGISKLGYVLEKINPMGTLLMFGAIAAGR
jgi:polysaccharide export outer membrane protein